MKDQKEDIPTRKTQFCKHHNSCVTNILKSSGKTFYWAFFMKYLLSKLLRSKEFMKRSPFSVLTTFNEDTVIFSLITTSI